MDKAIVNLLKIQNQLRILHWQTLSYAAHKALGNAYNDLDDLIDNLVEVHQGKYGRITFETPIDLGLVNQDEIDLEDILIQLNDYLSGPFAEMHDPIKDTDCLNIRDEILAVINKLRYLLTLK
jgi:Family of unknown function (DUF5856)